MILEEVAGHSVKIDLLPEVCSDDGWMTFEVAVTNFADCELLMHWGVGREQLTEWSTPSIDQARTSPTAASVQGAAQTAFPAQDSDGSRKAKVHISLNAGLKGFQFVLHRKPDEWLKCGSRNFIVDLNRFVSAKCFRDHVRKVAEESSTSTSFSWSSGGTDIAVFAGVSGSTCKVQALVNSDHDLVMQYSPAGQDRRWTSSTRLPLERVDANVRRGSITFCPEDLNVYCMFALHDTSTNQWLKDGEKDFEFTMPLKDAVALPLKATSAREEFSPPSRPEPQEASKFRKLVEQAEQEDTNAVVTAWNSQGLEVAVLVSAAEEHCNVHVLVNSKNELVFQYGLAGTDCVWKSSNRIVLAKVSGDVYQAVFVIPAAQVDSRLMFVLHDTLHNQWLKDNTRDFEVHLPRHAEWDRIQREEEARQLAVIQLGHSAFFAGRNEREAKSNVGFSTFELERECGHVDVAVYSQQDGTIVTVEVVAWLHPRLGECVLHFGVFPTARSWDWVCPLKQKNVTWPGGIIAVDDKAAQLKLSVKGELQCVEFSMPATVQSLNGEDISQPAIAGFGFVVKSVRCDEWLSPKDAGNASVRFTPGSRWKGEWAEIANNIVQQEMTWSVLSLMKRYENCLAFVADWEKHSEGMTISHLPSWSALVHVDTSQAIWKRVPSMPLCDLPEDRDSKARKEGFWSWMFVWHRFSFLKCLTWERNFCTQPRQLAERTNQITAKMAEMWKAHPSCRMWIRWTLATMGRGGSSGQKIRDEILEVMHSHSIKEIHGTYYEQWHQKLHNNTTPEDIGICRAIIAFFQSNGDMGRYWSVLLEHDITKDRLASYTRPITEEPYLPDTDIQRLINDLQNYLHTLRSVHDALDLQLALDNARWCLPGSMQGKLQEVCDMGGTGFSNLSEGHWKFLRISEARHDVLAMLYNSESQPNQIKELLVIDFTLETQQSALIQGMASEDRLPELSDQLKVLLTSLVGLLPVENELQAILADWTALAPDCAAQRWGSVTESALLLKAMTDRISRVVGELCDKCQNVMGGKAEWLGAQIDAPKTIIDGFVDGVLRGTSLMSVSLVLQRLEPVLRGLAHLPPWQIISPVDKPLQGELVLIDTMTNIQGKIYKTPTVLLSGAVNGEEETPDGVVAVLVRSAKDAPDILSHCAVRARNAGVLLASCYDPAKSAKVEELSGQWVEVRCPADGNMTVEPATRPKGRTADEVQPMVNGTKLSKDKKVQMNLANSLGCSWCIRPNEMTESNVGSKSLNLALLQPKLSDGILTPQAVALPYGCMQKALTDPANKTTVLAKLTEVLGRLQPSTSNADAQAVFVEAQQLVKDMAMPKTFEKTIVEAMTNVEATDGHQRIKSLFKSSDAWIAIKLVWASLFALRPWVSLAKAGRSFHDLNMAVLVQELVEAKYAFVLHTTNPFTHDKDELYGELYPGRGEAIVGNFPGRSLSFAVRRGGEARVLAFPSKSIKLHTQACLIFRSDSNGEDLEGFAGAGLFESVCAESDNVGLARLHRLPVVTDHAYRQSLLRRIAEAGWATEAAFGGTAQDIEGCVDVEDRLFIVQSRPQV